MRTGELENKLKTPKADAERWLMVRDEDVGGNRETDSDATQGRVKAEERGRQQEQCAAASHVQGPADQDSQTTAATTI